MLHEAGYRIGHPQGMRHLRRWHDLDGAVGPVRGFLTAGFGRDDRSGEQQHDKNRADDHA